MSEIILVGKGNISLVCYEALKKGFEKIYITKNSSKELRDCKRKEDEVVVDEFAVDCRLVFLAGWDQIIPLAKIEKKQYLNIHGSLLPKYRGMHSLYWAIMNGEDSVGYTIHEVVEKVDAGDILYQYKVKYVGQTVEEINNSYYENLIETLSSVILSYMKGNLKPQKQNHSEASWFPRRSLDDCLIDFNMSKIQLERFFKALTYSYPLPRLRFGGKVYEVTSHTILNDQTNASIGSVYRVESSGVWIKAMDCTLVVREFKDVESDERITPRSMITLGYLFHNS